MTFENKVFSHHTHEIWFMNTCFYINNDIVVLVILILYCDEYLAK